MKDFEVDQECTIYTPDTDGDVEIEINSYDCLTSKYVKFSDLEKWVAGVRQQIIDKAATNNQE